MIFLNIKKVDQKQLADLLRGASKKDYKEWRMNVLRRDGYQCQFPGCVCDSKLEVHHIKRQATRRDLKLELFNGITLCSACHDKIFGREESYEVLFMSIALKNGGMFKDKSAEPNENNS